MCLNFLARDHGRSQHYCMRYATSYNWIVSNFFILLLCIFLCRTSTSDARHSRSCISDDRWGDVAYASTYESERLNAHACGSGCTLSSWGFYPGPSSPRFPQYFWSQVFPWRQVFLDLLLSHLYASTCIVLRFLSWSSVSKVSSTIFYFYPDKGFFVPSHLFYSCPRPSFIRSPGEAECSVVGIPSTVSGFLRHHKTSSRVVITRLELYSNTSSPFVRRRRWRVIQIVPRNIFGVLKNKVRTHENTVNLHIDKKDPFDRI